MKTIEKQHVNVPPRCRGTRTAVAAMVRLNRELHGLTQHQLAGRMGSTQSTVARWESGEHEITMGTLARMADALGVVLTVDFGSSDSTK